MIGGPHCLTLHISQFCVMLRYFTVVGGRLYRIPYYILIFRQGMGVGARDYASDGGQSACTSLPDYAAEGIKVSAGPHALLQRDSKVSNSPLFTAVGRYMYGNPGVMKFMKR